jgi:hypothetical protein
MVSITRWKRSRSFSTVMSKGVVTVLAANFQLARHDNIHVRGYKAHHSEGRPGCG